MSDISLGTTAPLLFVLVDNAGVEVTGLGGGFTVTLSKAGGAFAASAGAKSEIGSGWYKYVTTAGETDTLGDLAVVVTGAGAVQQNLLYSVVSDTSLSATPAGTGPDYTTLEDIQDLLRISSIDGGDDAVIETLISEASRDIDNFFGRTFYPRTETHYYDLPGGRSLFIDDDDLLTITTLTNGDGSVINASDYLLLPKQGEVKWEIRLKETSSVYWLQDADGNTESVIAVAGTWGRMTNYTADIENLCKRLTVDKYRSRFGPSTEAPVTPAGVVIAGSNTVVPLELLGRYRRLI